MTWKKNLKIGNAGMEVKITDPAKASLKEICGHYRRLGFDTYAVKIRKLILERAKSLSKHPERCQEEEMLKELQQGHRYLLVESHFKIIYLVVEKEVVVTDIFDTHQDPDEMPKKKSIIVNLS